MTFTPRRWMFASSAWALGICMGASALASEPNAAADAAGATGAAVAGGGKAVFWSRDNAKFTLSGVTVAAPQWNAEVNTEDSRLAFTPEEQQELVQHLLNAAWAPLGLHSVQAMVAQDHPASVAVLQSAGFVWEAGLPRFTRIRGRWWDCELYSVASAPPAPRSPRGGRLR